MMNHVGFVDFLTRPMNFRVLSKIDRIWNLSVIFAPPIVVIFATVYGCYTLVPYKWKVTCNSHGCYTSSLRMESYLQ
jgi:hypothetical protein